jgi:hypothetical protein
MVTRTATEGPIKLDELVDWMAPQPPETEYVYSDPGRCPTALFLEASGFHDVEVVPGKATFAGGEKEIPPEVDFVLCGMPRTFGAAVDRARALAR